MNPILWTLLAACSPDPTVGTLADNVEDAFSTCNEAEIKFLATKHNFMPAFRPCGNNHFDDFAWSPDGTRLYFQLGLTHHVMNAESPTKDTHIVPAPSPIGPVTWVGAGRLVIPVGPEADGGPLRLAIYDLDQASVFFVALPADLAAPRDLQRDLEPGKILLSATRGAGPRLVWRADTSDGTVEEAFPGLGPVDTFTYTPNVDAVIVGRGETVEWRTGLTGALHGSWSPATRGAMHPSGQWLVLEHLGAPVSVFHQRAWDELSEAAREREMRRVKQFEETLPPGFETEVRPPTLSFVEVPTGKRWRLDSVQGHQFEWYEPTDFYGSFVLWGFESKQFKRNVLLGNLADRLRASAQGKDFLGVSPFGEAEGARYVPGVPVGTRPAPEAAAPEAPAAPQPPAAPPAP